MKRNVNVFIGVVLCAVLCGCFVWLSTASEDDAWSPNEIYNEVARTSSYSSSYTNATFSASSGDGLALSMGSSSSLSRARVGASYAGVYRGVAATPLASSPLASSSVGGGYGAGLYTTSSAQLKSFGGGGNGGAAMGGSARSAAMSNSQSPVAHGAMGMSPITYTAARVKNTPSVAPAMVSSGDMMAVMAANYGMGGYTSAVYAGNFSGTYDQYVGVYGGATNSYAGITGRRNAGVTDSWLDWFYRYGYDYGTKSDSTATGTGWTYTYTYTEDQLHKAYEDYINNYWDPMWHPGESAPTFDQWLEWLQNDGNSGYEYNGNWYMMAPVGDILPLLLLALLYVVAMYLRSKVRAQANDENGVKW